jgi:long-subunit acyl-CoA synthetase (AMP-forming)
MKGYWNKPRQSPCADLQGWLATGDIGEWMLTGSRSPIARRTSWSRLG